MIFQEPARTGARRVGVAAVVAVGALLVAASAQLDILGDRGPVVFGAASDHPTSDNPAALDDDTPAVSNLDPDLLDALRRAASDAEQDGLELRVNSGWRSAAHQEQLLRDAVAEYGSEEEAARWVASPEKSAHVSGDAVDIGPARGAAWLAEHGASYGLCQIYRNEPWHFELRPEAVWRECPPMYDDPTHDPRLR